MNDKLKPTRARKYHGKRKLHRVAFWLSSFSSPGKKFACLHVEGEKVKNILTKGSNEKKAMRALLVKTSMNVTLPSDLETVYSLFIQI